MTTTPAAPAPQAGSARTLHLSDLLRRPLTDRGGESLGRLSDVIVRLRGAELPLVTGLVATVGGREVYVPIEQVSSFDGEVLKLTSARLDLRRFERRDGEVLLRADVLGHRLIDVERAHLIKAADLELEQRGSDWVLSGVDTRRRARRFLGLGSPAASEPGEHPFREWAQVRAADRPFRQRAAARPVRPHPPAQARPDRRPARGGLQGGGDRDPRPGARRPRARGGRVRGTRRGSGDPAARRPHRHRDRRGAGPDARRRRGGRHRRAAAAPPPARARPAAARPADQGADADGVQPDQRRRPDGRRLPRRFRRYHRPAGAGRRRAGRPACSPRR